VDDAIQVGAARIRILHGTGTGCLDLPCVQSVGIVLCEADPGNGIMLAGIEISVGKMPVGNMLTLVCCTHGRSRQTKRRSKNLSTEIVSTGSRLAV